MRHNGIPKSARNFIKLKSMKYQGIYTSIVDPRSVMSLNRPYEITQTLIKLD